MKQQAATAEAESQQRKKLDEQALQVGLEAEAANDHQRRLQEEQRKREDEARLRELIEREVGSPRKPHSLF